MNMPTKVVLVLVILALVAAAGTVSKLGVYQVTLSRPAAVNGITLKPGDYKLLVGDARITMTAKDGGNAIEAPVRIESVPVRFDITVVTYETHDSKTAISEIDLGGSKTKLVFAQ
jgi:hypothetical protein